MTTTMTKTTTEFTEKEVEALRKELREIERSGRGADYDRAAWAKKIVNHQGLHARRSMIDQFKMSSGTASAYLRRLEDQQIVPQRVVWVAVGWAVVRQIVTLDQAVREKVVREILSASKGESGVLSGYKTREIIRPYLPPKEKGENCLEGGSDNRRRGAKIARALSELRHILETYDLPGYEPPADVLELTGAKIEK